MAYEIIGNVFRIGATENISTKNGVTLLRRFITLCQKRFDQNTGEEFEPNYPSFDFTNKGCAELDKFNVGDRVKILFGISGVKYIDKQTNEEKYFNSLRGFRIERYVQPSQMPQFNQQTQQPAYPPQYQPQQYYQGQQQYYQQQQPSNAQPFPPQVNKDGLPF